MRVKDSGEGQGKKGTKAHFMFYVEAMDLKDMLVCVLQTKQASSIYITYQAVWCNQMCTSFYIGLFFYFLFFFKS